MASPFLSIDGFTTDFGRSLTAAETDMATRLLQITSDWITAQNPDVDPTAAAQVVFEVTRDQLNLGEFSPLVSFANTTAHRTQSGTFDSSADLLKEVITDRQKRLLGIELRAAPSYSFPVDDYAISGLDYPTTPYGYFPQYGLNS